MTTKSQNGAINHWVVVRPEPPGKFTAQAVGLPDICATGTSREEALLGVHAILDGLLTSGQLVAMEIHAKNPLFQWFGQGDPNDPNEQAYLEQLDRFRREDLDKTLEELK